MILERLLPTLQALAPVTPGIDVDGLAEKVVAEVKKAVNQLDAHEIKEQVSDLVVERLDPRLANQNAEQTEVIVGRIHEMMQESVVNGLGPIPDTGGEGLWKRAFTCWEHFSLWQKVPPMFLPDTFHSHSKCNLNI